MSKKIIWTELSEVTYYENLEYLRDKWHSKQVLKFISQVDEVTQKIAKGLIVFRQSEEDDRINVAFINKQVSLYYKVVKDKVYLLFFWNNYKEPKEKEYYIAFN